MGKRDKNDKLRWTIPARTDHPDPEKSKTPPQCHSCLFRRLDSESVLGRTKSGRVTLSSKRVRANTNVAKLCRGSECCHSFWWTGSRSFCSQYYFLYGYPIFFFSSRDLDWLITLTFSERQHQMQTAMKSSDSDHLLFFLCIAAHPILKKDHPSSSPCVRPRVTRR